MALVAAVAAGLQATSAVQKAAQLLQKVCMLGGLCRGCCSSAFSQAVSRQPAGRIGGLAGIRSIWRAVSHSRRRIVSPAADGRLQ